ncbi:MAG: hypothetical protein IPK33_22335 [Gemmatimonadetes bacterium]|nr:hypothetical protein [Gemmatimonadota bacterium]
MSNTLTIAQLWRRLLIDVELARNYPLASFDVVGAQARNPILERLLPSLLLVKAVAVLDAAISEYVASRGLSIPRGTYGTSLNGKIEFLVDESIFPDGDDLHRIRDVRNVIAHDANGDTTWSALDNDIGTLNGALKTLGFVGDPPRLEFFAERRTMDKPDRPDALFGFRHVFGVKEDSRLVATVEHKQYVMKDDT